MASRDDRVLHVRAGAPAPGDAPLGRLDRWLAGRAAALPGAPELSRARLQALIRDGRVSAGGATITDPSAPVKPGLDYAVSVPEAAPAALAPEPIALDIVHEDDHLVVVDKPAGMAVHPAPGSPDGTLANALLAHCGDSLSGIGGERRPGIVHRLDKGTTGLMVAAKTDEAHRGLAHQFAARAVERRYLALAWGAPALVAGRIEGPIGRDRRNRKKMAVTARGGKPAATRYRVLRRFRDVACLLECRLESGRTHQVRVHLAHIGHAPVGDPLYGRGGRRKGATEAEARAAAAFGRQALHAAALAFEHPADGAPMAFERPPPADMAALLEAFASPARKP